MSSVFREVDTREIIKYPHEHFIVFYVAAPVVVNLNCLLLYAAVEDNKIIHFKQHMYLTLKYNPEQATAVCATCFGFRFLDFFQ